MTPTDINAIADRHLDLWMADGPQYPGKIAPTLRDRCADMIREALALRDKQWEDGQITLRHELQQAQDTIDTLRGVTRT